MGLLDKIKSEAKKSGANKGKLLFFKEGQKVRIRFLSDMEDGMELVFHDSYSAGVNVPCQEAYGRTCKYCDEEGLRTRSQYIWSVWDYEAKEVKLLMAAINNCSPVPMLAAAYETYGTLCDRDYVIQKSGKQQNTTFSVIPMDKVKFRNEKAKPYSKSKVLAIIDKAYPADDVDDEDDEDDTPRIKKGSKVSKQNAKGKSRDYDDDDDDDNDGWDDEDEGSVNYEDMSPRELFALCKERGIDARPKKPQKYYVDLLEEYDNQKDDWGDDDDEDDDDGWGDDDE